MMAPPSARGGTRETPLVSVVTPAYNAQAWIRDAIGSALAQTHPNVEVIVVDDGSTDDTRRVAASLGSSRVTVLAQRHRGASAARNMGLAAARGSYVQYLDADDLLSADKIERQVKLLEAETPEHVAVCDTVYFRDGNNPLHGRRVTGCPVAHRDDPVRWLVELWTPGPGYGITRWEMVHPAAWLVPRACIESAGPWDETLSVDDDGEYFTRVLGGSRGVRFEPDSVTYYRQAVSGGSLSGGRSHPHLRSRLRSVDAKANLTLPRMRESDIAHARLALARQYMDVAFNAHPLFPDIVHDAEQRAAALGGYTQPFFDYSLSARLVERVFGWKTARRLSLTARAFRNK